MFFRKTASMTKLEPCNASQRAGLPMLIIPTLGRLKQEDYHKF